MKKVVIGLGFALVVAGLIFSGVAAANWFWYGRAHTSSAWRWMPMMRSAPAFSFFGIKNPQNETPNTPYGCGQTGGSTSFYGGMMGGRRFGGMMGGYRGSNAANPGTSCPYLNPGSGESSGPRLTMDQAQAALEQYVGSNSDLALMEIMEFEENFYAVIVEQDTGRGATELLVDPVSGSVFPEYGPNMMWNEKYGHMGSWYSTSGRSLPRDEAKAIAQTALDEAVPGAAVEGDGVEFYGYFTFDYEIDGQIAGMLSVNTNGRTWLHDWHGVFIREVELDE